MVQLEKFSSRRVTAVATHNASSRSHMVMSLLVKETIEGREAQLVLVDLAGSEKYDSVMEHVSHANIKVQQLRKKECQEINTSLMCLGTVMRGLGQKQVRRVPSPINAQRGAPTPAPPRPPALTHFSLPCRLLLCTVTYYANRDHNLTRSP